MTKTKLCKVCRNNFRAVNKVIGETGNKLPAPEPGVSVCSTPSSKAVVRSWFAQVPRSLWISGMRERKAAPACFYSKLETTGNAEV